VVGTRRHRRSGRAVTPHDVHGQRRRIFRFSLNCFSCGHEAGEVDSIEEAKLRRCERCGGQVFVERDTATPVYVDDRRLRR
jgi:DNA-directed RNA polymerase subunit RPC12/RpoP